jgi:uncharacterized protein YciI
MAHFMYKLIPPRPSFALDMNDHEAARMGEHAAYWRDQLDRGRVVVFGPVLDTAGVWGLGVLEVDDEDHARRLIDDDPVVADGLCVFELHPMDAIVRSS